MAHDQHIVSWDDHYINDGINYTAGFKPGLQWGLPSVGAELVARTGRWPLIGSISRPGVRLFVLIRIEDMSNVRTLRDQLCRWFDPEDETPKPLVIEDETGGLGYIGNDRYVYAICEALQPVVGQGLAADEAFVATLAVHGDVRWRSIIDDADVWAVTFSGDMTTVNNGGMDDAYPILTIEPTGGLTGGYDYKRFIPLRWNVSTTYTAYPVDICNDGFDTSALIPGKMQADGDDLRVWCDGVEIDRWLDGINTATTKVWCNLDFQTMWEGTIVAGIGAGDTVTTLDVNEAITGAPSSGILVIVTGANYEVFTYTGKNNSLQRFTGVTRAAKGTTAIAHNADDVIWWCQHDLWILYGNAGAAAPVVDGDYEPAFELDHSTNVSWVYEEFGEDDGLRPGQWTRVTLGGTPSFYGGNRGAAADPWVELGIHHDTGIYPWGAMQLYNPCGMTNANFTNGEKWADAVGQAIWNAQPASIRTSENGSSWTTEDTIAAPAVASTWEAWSDNEALTAGALYLQLAAPNWAIEIYLECADCTVSIDDEPTVTIGDEQGNYSLDVVIENQTTGDQIRVTYTMALNDELEIDTDDKTVTDLEDGSSQFQALELVGGPRREWLRLLPGANTLEWTQSGTTGVMVSIDWTERWY